MRVLFFLFIVMPVIEMWLLIQVGSRIGAFNTITLVLLTAVLGAWLLREQGISTLFRFNQRLEQGELPAKEILEGFLLGIGGALLLTPGFVTDAVGFVCLIPVLRSLLIQQLLKNGAVSMSGSHYKETHSGHQERHIYTDKDGHNTIDGEYRRDD
jgi:UPF0716 protein FxsA